MSNIPEARRLLNALRDRLRTEPRWMGPDEIQTHLDEILPLLDRQAPIRKSEIRSAMMTKGLAKTIRACATANPEWSQMELAELFHVNTGRVSEALNNKR